MIKVWRWREAPEEYRVLSRTWDDMDFVVVGPSSDVLAKLDLENIVHALTVCDSWCAEHGDEMVCFTCHA